MALFGILMANLASFSEGFGDVISRTLKDVYISIIIFWYGLLATIGSLLYLLITSELSFAGYTSQQYFLLGLAVLCAVVALTANIVAFQADSSGFVALLSFVVLVWAYAADMLIFNEEFKTMDLVASAVILITTFTIAVIKLKSKEKQKQAISQS